MSRRKSFAQVEQSLINLRRSPRFGAQNEAHLRQNLRNPNLEPGRRFPNIGNLKTAEDSETPNLESLRNQAPPSSTARNCVSPISGSGNGNGGADQCVVGGNRKEQEGMCFGSELRRSRRLGKLCAEHSDGLTYNKSSAEVRTAGRSENGCTERSGLRRSSRLSSQKISYIDAEPKLDSVFVEIAENEYVSSEQLDKKNRRRCSSPVGSQEEIREAGHDNEGEKAEAGKRKRNRGKGANGVVPGWTKEQEMALERAYLAMKPTPHFWKKVSKMVGKSAQECFDRINYDSNTPIGPRHRSRVKKKTSPSASCSSLSASKLLCRPIATKKRKTHLSQKKVRELLQKHCTLEKDYEGDLFSVLEGNIGSPLRVSQQTSGSGVCTPQIESPRKGSSSFSTRKKSVSRFSSAAQLISPPVLKPVKNKALHEKYIDQLHCRDAKRRAEFTRAKKTTVGKENLTTSCNQKPNIVKAAKHALESDARDVIRQFQQLQNSPSEDEDDDIQLVDEENEDEL
uniref:Myb-like domain-containing protein n=1 Tax=Kalanchoe fedtschenkoi TaxID=63787 RepID=A0A7N0VDL6_KALFE